MIHLNGRQNNQDFYFSVRLVICDIFAWIYIIHIWFTFEYFTDDDYLYFFPEFYVSIIPLSLDQINSTIQMTHVLLSSIKTIFLYCIQRIVLVSFYFFPHYHSFLLLLSMKVIFHGIQKTFKFLLFFTYSRTCNS